jgi:hypothetical protein
MIIDWFINVEALTARNEWRTLSIYSVNSILSSNPDASLWTDRSSNDSCIFFDQSLFGHRRELWNHFS